MIKNNILMMVCAVSLLVLTYDINASQAQRNVGIGFAAVAGVSFAGAIAAGIAYRKSNKQFKRHYDVVTTHSNFTAIKSGLDQFPNIRAITKPTLDAQRARRNELKIQALKKIIDARDGLRSSIWAKREGNSIEDIDRLVTKLHAHMTQPNHDCFASELRQPAPVCQDLMDCGQGLNYKVTARIQDTTNHSWQMDKPRYIACEKKQNRSLIAGLACGGVAAFTGIMGTLILLKNK